jgi:hypothetical protein
MTTTLTRIAAVAALALGVAAGATTGAAGTARARTSAAGGQPVEIAFDTSQSWTVPSGVSCVTFTVQGAPGGVGVGLDAGFSFGDGAAGGRGARIVATVPVQGTLDITVGTAGTAGTLGAGAGTGGSPGGGDGAVVSGPVGGGEGVLASSGGGGAGSSFVTPDASHVQRSVGSDGSSFVRARFSRGGSGCDPDESDPDEPSAAAPTVAAPTFTG